MKYAIVKDGIVVNICKWDGLSQWNPPVDSVVVNVDNTVAGPGFTYNGETFEPPVEPPPIEE